MTREMIDTQGMGVARDNLSRLGRAGAAKTGSVARSMKAPPPDVEFLSRIELYFSMRQLTRTLRRFAEVFDRDYDSAMIFLVVVEDGFRAIFHLAPSFVAEANFRDLYLDAGAEGLSLLQIGEATGIARETVRRKTHKLIDSGFLGLNKKNKNINLPFETITNPIFADIFQSQIKDVDQFIRSVQFYAAPKPAT